MADEDFRYKAGATAAACRAIGWDFRVVGEPEPVWATNLRWLAGYRHPRFSNEDLEAELLSLFAEARPLAETARRAGDPIRVRPVLFHLLWRGDLAGDLTRPLGETGAGHTLRVPHLSRNSPRPSRLQASPLPRVPPGQQDR